MLRCIYGQYYLDLNFTDVVHRRPTTNKSGLDLEVTWLQTGEIIKYEPMIGQFPAAYTPNESPVC